VELQKMVETIQRSAANIALTLEPDEDWAPVIFMVTDDDLIISGLPTEAFENDHTKDALVRALGVIIEEIKPVQCALILPSWRVRNENYDQEAIERLLRDGISNHPDREECLVLQAMDAEHHDLYMADVIRVDGSHPELGEFIKQDGLPDGRFGSLQAAMILAANA
jgi:hypothetical protein